MSYNSQQPMYDDPNAPGNVYTTAPAIVSPPTVTRSADGSATYYYNCTPADFVNNSKWVWLVPLFGGILLILATFLPWLTIATPTNSFNLNAFGGVGGTLPPEFATTLTTGGQQESILGINPVVGTILVVLGLIIVGLSIVSFFSNTPIIAYLVTGAAGLALAFTIFQMLTIASKTAELTSFVNRQAAQATAAGQTALTVGEIRLNTSWGVLLAVVAAIIAVSGSGFQTYRTRAK